MWTRTGKGRLAASPARSIILPMPVRPNCLAALIDEHIRRLGLLFAMWLFKTRQLIAF
jgi:hypothetical protein